MSAINRQTKHPATSEPVNAEAILAQQLTPFTVKADFGHGYAKAICGERKTIFSTAISGVRADEAAFTQVVPIDGYIRLITQIPISWFSQRDQMYKLAGSYPVTSNGRTSTYVL